MEVIASFTIDHTKLLPGIYVSRDDEDFRTFDIRLTTPNVEEPVSPAALHTIEHLMATWFRNNPIVKEDVVYVGPMGCLTGMYIILKTNKNSWTPQQLKGLMITCINWILLQTEVPATTPETCGNCKLHNLEDAKAVLAKYKDNLLTNFQTEYTKLQVYLDNGMQFADA